MRHQRSLAGTWQFAFDPDGEVTVGTLRPDREIEVPMPWQAAFPELQQYSGYAWYRLPVEISEEWLEGELLLHFGAVDYWCQVFVNGQFAGEHEGGHTSFTLPIKHLAQAGSNDLAVRVYDPVQSEIRLARWPGSTPEVERPGPPFNATNVPHGKQEWYINCGGIWQDVTLTAVPSTYVQHVRVVPDIYTGEAHLTVELGGAEIAADGDTLKIEVRGVDEKVALASTNLHLVPGQRTYEGTVTVEGPRLWDLDDPHLYTAHASIKIGELEDSLEVRFGFREIKTEEGRILLNGEPLFLLAALDQDLYPDTIYTVPSEEYLRDEFKKAKQLGLNCLRCHIKPPDPRYLDLADEMGLLVWAEIPSWRTFHPKTTIYPGTVALEENIRKRAEQTLEEMVRRDFNHPSIVIWTIVNEDWGTSLPLSAADRAWVARMYDRCKELDPTRLVVDNSACPHAWGPNIHVKSDLDDFHIYTNIPDQAKVFERAIEQFNLRPLWTYSSMGDADRTGQEPLILSEFGNWGMPSLEALREPSGEDPGWFNIGPWWSSWEGEPGWPSGVEERFEKLGLGEVWGSYEEFAKQTQWHQFAAMKFEIEAIRRQPSLSGYVITELTDIYWESNGLLDFRRNLKVYHDLFASVNAPDVIVPCLRRYALWDDGKGHLSLYASHYSPTDWTNARLSLEVGEATGGKKEVPIRGVRRGSVRSLGSHSFSPPKVEQARGVPVTFSVQSREGEALASNSIEVFVLPSADREPFYKETIAVISRRDPSRLSALDETNAPPEPGESIDWGAPTDLAGGDDPEEGEIKVARNFPAGLRQLGYLTQKQASAGIEVAVTNFPNAELLQWVREGGKLLYISSGQSPFFWVQGRGGAYSGGWITSFSWLRPGVHRRLQHAANPLGLPFMGVMPRATILGLPVEQRECQGDFLAGMIAGWVRHPAIHTVQFLYGKGRVVMTTFALDEAVMVGDPVGIAMFHDLIEHLASDRCQPKLEVNLR